MLMIIESILYELVRRSLCHFYKNYCFSNSADSSIHLFYVQNIQFVSIFCYSFNRLRNTFEKKIEFIRSHRDIFQCCLKIRSKQVILLRRSFRISETIINIHSDSNVVSFSSNTTLPINDPLPSPSTLPNSLLFFLSFVQQNEFSQDGQKQNAVTVANRKQATSTDMVCRCKSTGIYTNDANPRNRTNVGAIVVVCFIKSISFKRSTSNSNDFFLIPLSATM